MSSHGRILVVGSHAPGLFVRVNRVPKAGETVIGWDYHEPQDGGKGSNQAIAAARLGGRVSFAGCVGRDRIGDEGSRWMADAGVDLTYLQRHASLASGIGFILLEDDGVPAMVTTMGANAALTAGDIERALDGLPDAHVALFQFETPPEVMLEGVALARRRGLTAILNPAPAVDGLPVGMGAASILVPNESEAGSLLQRGEGASLPLDAMAAELRTRCGVPTVLITAGEQGVFGIDDEGPWHVRALKVEAVDTSGAGDVFCAALAVAIAEGATIRSASEWACKVASLSVTQPGTIPSFPTRLEAERVVGSTEHPSACSR